MAKNKLTAEQIEEMRAVYKTLETNKNGVMELAKKFDRTPNSLSASASKLGITNSSRPRIWLRGVDPSRWEITSNEETGRGQARRMYREMPECCERCGLNKKLDRHHIDSNTFNNERSNIAFLCRRCHLEVDGRMDSISDVREVRLKDKPKNCLICSKPGPKLRNGRCERCRSYFDRTGLEWSENMGVRRRKPKIGVCPHCKRLNNRCSDVLCKACYIYKRTHDGRDRPIAK